MFVYLFKTLGLSLLCAVLLCISIMHLTPQAFASDTDLDLGLNDLDPSKTLVNTFSLHATSIYSKNDIPLEIVVRVNNSSNNLYSDDTNAIIVLSKFLDSVQNDNVDYELAVFNGGIKRADTANIAMADIVLNKKKYEMFMELVSEAKTFYSQSGNHVVIELKKTHRPVIVLDEESKDVALALPIMMSKELSVYGKDDNMQSSTILNLRSFSVNTHGVYALAVVSSSDKSLARKVEQNLIRIASLLGYSINSSNDLDSLSSNDTYRFDLFASNSFSDQGVW
jgi:hypothetical protein